MNSSHGRTLLIPLMLLVHQSGLSLCIEQGVGGGGSGWRGAGLGCWNHHMEEESSGRMEPAWAAVGEGGRLSLGSVSSEPADESSYQHVTQSKQSCQQVSDITCTSDI